MRAKFPREPLSAEKQVQLALSLLELHGATKPDLWHALDEVMSAKNREIERLRNGLQVALDRWSKQ